MSETYDLLVRIKAQADEAIRKLKGLETQVSKTSGMMDSFKQAGAQAAGMLMRDMVNAAGRSLGEAVELGASIESLRNSFVALQEGSEGTILTMDLLKEATRGTVSEVDLLKSVNSALLLGIKPDVILEMAEASVALGAAVGGDTLYAFESLTTGVGRQSKLMLDNVGILVDVNAAHVAFAEKLGKSTSELTEQEKTMAFNEIVMVAMREKTDQLGDSVGEGTIRAQTFTAELEDMKTSAGTLIGRSALGGIAPILDDLAPVFGTFAGTLIPNLIVKYGALGLATTTWGAITSAVSGLVTTAFMGIPIIGWIAAAIAAIVLLRKAWKENWFGIRDTTKQVVDSIVKTVERIVKWAKRAISALKSLFKKRAKAKKESSSTGDPGVSVDEQAQFGFQGTLGRDTIFLAHKGEHVSVSRPGAPRGGGLTINGPLVVIEGNADEATARLAADIVMRQIRRYS